MLENRPAVNTIYLPNGSSIPVYPLPFSQDLEFGKTIRPKVSTYKEGLEWNKKGKEHTFEALTFVQEYGSARIHPHYDNKAWVVSLADIHWGHKDVDYDFADKLLSTVENTPDTYAVVGWNLLDAAIPSQFPDGVMWSNMTAQEQVYTFRDKLRALYDKKKLLGGIGDCSCHEGWMKRGTGWMIYRELFEGMDDVPLLKNGGYLDITVNDETYRTAHFHKTKYWSQFNKTHGGDRAMDRIVDAEIVFTSHIHQAAVGQTERYNPPFTKNTAVISSGTCKLQDNFTRGHMGKDGEKGGQGIMLWGDKHKFQVIYDLDIGAEIMWQKKLEHDRRKLEGKMPS